jgi:hypothetical protein
MLHAPQIDRLEKLDLHDPIINQKNLDMIKLYKYISNMYGIYIYTKKWRNYKKRNNNSYNIMFDIKLSKSNNLAKDYESDISIIREISILKYVNEEQIKIYIYELNKFMDLLINKYIIPIKCYPDEIKLIIDKYKVTAISKSNKINHDVLNKILN